MSYIKLKDMDVVKVFVIFLLSINIDAVNGLCTVRHYSCKSGECISGNKRCDRHHDCPEGDDEEGCSKYSIKGFQPVSS